MSTLANLDTFPVKRQSPPNITVASTVMVVGKSHLASSEWTWESLRDYVLTEIQKVAGAVPRQPLKEKGIFSGFINRWGAENAQMIARYVFEVEKGRWMGAPMNIYRFSERSDASFAKPIAERLGL